MTWDDNISLLQFKVDVLQNLDSGIETSDFEEDDDHIDNILDNSLFDVSLFTLCSECASSIPEVSKYLYLT